MQNFQGDKRIEYIVNKNICFSYLLLIVVQCFSEKLVVAQLVKKYPNLYAV
jgi:hypothetical protein